MLESVCFKYSWILTLLGFFVLLIFIIKCIWGIMETLYVIILSKFSFQDSLVARYGSWALVTGSTDGIGKAYAKELAKRGINLVLVSRNKEKLEDTAKEIENEHQVRTKIIKADFSNGIEAIATIKKEIGDIPIGILVNNVGKLNEYPMYLHESSEKEIWDMININIGTVTLLTRIFITDMIKNNKGAIINISSASELKPFPFFTIYGATKSYMKNFSSSLLYEYKNTNIVIQHLAPMCINTKLIKFSEKLQKTNICLPNAEIYAKNAIETLGIKKRSTGYWVHGIGSFFYELLPEFMAKKYIGSLNKAARRSYLVRNNLDYEEIGNQ